MRAQPAPAALRGVVGVTGTYDRGHHLRGSACGRAGGPPGHVPRGVPRARRTRPCLRRPRRWGSAAHRAGGTRGACVPVPGRVVSGCARRATSAAAPHAVRSPRRRSPRATATRAARRAGTARRVDPESQVRAFVALTWPEPIAGPRADHPWTSTASTGSGGRTRPAARVAVRSPPRRRLRLRRWCGAARRCPRPAQLSARAKAVDRLLNLEVAIRSYLGCMPYIGH